MKIHTKDLIETVHYDHHPGNVTLSGMSIEEGRRKDERGCVVFVSAFIRRKESCKYGINEKKRKIGWRRRKKGKVLLSISYSLLFCDVVILAGREGRGNILTAGEMGGGREGGGIFQTLLFFCLGEGVEIRRPLCFR